MPGTRIPLVPVSRVMRKPVIVEPETPATRVRRLFRDLRLRIVAVAGPDGKLQGVIKRTGVLRFTSTKSEAQARDIMEDVPFTLSEANTVKDAFRLMTKYDEWYGIVVGASWRVHGVVGMEDFVRLGLEEAPEMLKSRRVSEIMSGDVVYVRPEDSISRIWRMMESLGYAGFPVVNEKGRLVGIITQYDLIRKGYTRIELESESGPKPGPRVSEAMTYSVEYAYPWTSVEEVARMIVERGYGRIPVVDGPRTRVLVGVVDREDVARLVVGG